MVSWKRKAAGEHSFRISTDCLPLVRLLFLAFAVTLLAPLSIAQTFSAGGLGSSVTPFPAAAELTGMAYAGVALPSDGASSFLLNPARLASVEPGVSASLLGRQLKYEFTDFYANAYSLTAGIAPEASSLRFGVGLGRSTLDLGEQVTTDAQGNEGETFDFVPAALVFGGAVQYDGPVSVALGVAARRVSEPNVLRFFSLDPEDEVGDLIGWGVDLGLQAHVPLVRASDGGFSASVGLGYAIQNWGGTQSLTSSESALSLDYPMATLARLGWSASFGYDVERLGRDVRAAHVDVALEASHVLTREEYERTVITPDGEVQGAFPTYRTAAPLGRIRALDALLGRGREPGARAFGNDLIDTRAAAVVGHRALRVVLYEALTLRAGTYTDPVFFDPDEESTYYSLGLGLSAAGLFRFLDPLSSLAALGERGDVRLSYAYYDYYEETELNPDPTQPWSLGLTLVARWP